jgi:hypothetical protein
MRILVDENAPFPLMPPLRHVLRDHEVTHVTELKWAGKKDIPILRDAAGRGFEAFITKDINQLSDPDETDAIKRSGMHHIRFSQPQPRLSGLALAMGAVLGAMPLVVPQLLDAPAQRLVRIEGMSPHARHRFTMMDPRREPPVYWRA